MAIEFRCTHCSKLLRTGDDTAGRQAKCPDCGAVMTIPAAGPAAGGGPPPLAPSGSSPFSAGPQPAPPAAAGPPVLDFGDVFGRTWEIFKEKMGLCVLVALIPGLIVGALYLGLYVLVIAVHLVMRAGMLTHLFFLLGVIVVMLVVACLMVALLRVFLKIARGQETSLGEVFVFDAAALAPVLTAIVFGLIVNLGFVFCIVPGVYLMVMFYPCVAIAVDRKLAVGDALAAAKQMTEGNRLNLFLLWLVSTLGAGAVNSLTCGLGILVTSPFLLLLYAMIYLTLAGEPTAEQLKVRPMA